VEEADAAGPLDVTTSSTIALDAGDHTLTFGGITANPPGSVTLQISGWAGAANGPGQGGKLVFANLGTTPNATYAGFLSRVQFDGYSTGQAIFLPNGSNFELVPTPEPASALAAAAAVGGAVLLVRRARRRSSQG